MLLWKFPLPGWHTSIHSESVRTMQELRFDWSHGAIVCPGVGVSVANSKEMVAEVMTGCDVIVNPHQGCHSKFLCPNLVIHIVGAWEEPIPALCMQYRKERYSWTGLASNSWCTAPQELAMRYDITFLMGRRETSKQVSSQIACVPPLRYRPCIISHPI